MYWAKGSGDEFKMEEVLLSDEGDKRLGRVGVVATNNNWETAYYDEKDKLHNLGQYADFHMAKQIVEDRVNARAG